MDKLFYSISETASMLGETVVTVRFWSNSFTKFLAPRRNAKGNRQYTADDVETLRRIQHLTRSGGLSLEAVARKLSEKGSDVDKTLEIKDSLLRIREQLEQIRKTL